MRVHSFCTIEDSVILPGRGREPARAPASAWWSTRAAVLPEGFTAGFDPEEDRRRFHVTEKGITLITPDMLGQKSSSLTSDA